jgi:murein DD-endopeptidase MepM/ murein hydrolase activator NlpD
MTPTTRRRRKRYASIIIVPPERDEPVNLNLPAWAYYLILGGIPALLAVTIGGVFLTSWMATRLSEMRAVEARNIELEDQAAKLGRLEQQVRDFEDFRLRVLDLAGADVRDEIEARATARLESTGMTTLEASRGGPPLPESSPLADRVGTLPSLWPVEGVISRDFQVDGDLGAIHYGIDIAATFRAAVRASGAGTVVFAGRDSVFGQLVVIDHGKDVHSLYGHNSSLEVGQGDRVKRGQTIARVGSTGESSAPHLHFEVRRGGKAINPRTYLVE